MQRKRNQDSYQIDQLSLSRYQTDSKHFLLPNCSAIFRLLLTFSMPFGSGSLPAETAYIHSNTGSRSTDNDMSSEQETRSISRKGRPKLVCNAYLKPKTELI